MACHDGHAPVFGREGPKFDVVVCGTGATQSLISAALSRCGLSVLHLDANGHYGGRGATFPWGKFVQWSQDARQSAQMGEWRRRLLDTPVVRTEATWMGGGHHHRTCPDAEVGDLVVDGGVKLFVAPVVSSATRRFSWRVTESSIPQTWIGAPNVPGAEANVDACKWIGTRFRCRPGEPHPRPADVFSRARDFNIDLRPRALLCRGRPVAYLLTAVYTFPNFLLLLLLL